MKMDPSSITNNPGGNGNNNEPPAITLPGTPIDDPVTKTIGVGGGSLTAPDGKLTLNIPAGALSNDLDVSIQPVTNEAPGGIGIGYDLMPSGTTFKTPVTLVYHYTDDDIDGTNPLLLQILTQDSIGEWKSLNNEDLDTLAKTITINTPHFSNYVTAASVRFQYEKREFMENESGFIKVMVTERGYVPQSPAGEDDLPSLPTPPHQANGDSVSHWSLNDQGKTTIYGNITGTGSGGTGSKVIFEAPSAITEDQRVKVSAEVTGSFVASVNGRLVRFHQVIVVGYVKLITSNHDYKLHLESRETILNNPNSTYLDKADMDVFVRGNDVQIPPGSIVNSPPSINPLKFTVGFCVGTYALDSSGKINVTGASGSIVSNPSGRKLIISLYQSDLHDFGWDIDCTPDHTNDSHVPFTSISSTQPIKLSFSLISDPQTFPLDNGNPQEVAKAVLTPQ